MCTATKHMILSYSDTFCDNQYKTRSSAVTERPHNASCLSVVSFNIPTATERFLLPVTAASNLLVHKILLWLGYPMVKKFWRHLYSFWRNSQMWQDTQTDRQTDTAWQHGRGLCIASRGKNDVPVLYRENWPKSTAVITGVIFTCRGQAGLVFSLDHRRPRLFRNYNSVGCVFSTLKPIITRHRIFVYIE